MSYTTLIEKETSEINSLVILKPRRRILAADFTLISGSFYQTTFSYGTIDQLKISGVEQVEATSLAGLSANQWFYDKSTQKLYLDFSSIGVLTDSYFVVVRYKMFLATKGGYYHEDPTDVTTDEVYYEGVVQSVPNIINSTSDVYFGFIPSFTGNLECSNVESFFNRHSYDSSFSKAPCYFYSAVNEIIPDNTSLLISGYTSSFSLDDAKINFQIKDLYSFLNKTVTHTFSGTEYLYVSEIYSNTLERFDSYVLKRVFGMMDGVKGINVDYASTAGTTDNRTWFLTMSDSNQASSTFTTTVKSSPASTSTRIYVNDVSGFSLGDSVYNSTQDHAGIVQGINVGSSYIDVTPLYTNIAGIFLETPASGDTIVRSWCSLVCIFDQYGFHRLRYGIHYTTYVDGSTGACGITLLDNIEGISASNPYRLNLSNSQISPDANLYARVYGAQNTLTLNGSSFGSDNSTLKCLTGIGPLLYRLLVEGLGVDQSDAHNYIDADSFNQLLTDVTYDLGFSIPQRLADGPMTYQEAINKICQTGLIKLFIDKNGKFKALASKPFSQTTSTLTDQNIIKNSISHEVSYQDLYSEVEALYGFREAGTYGPTWLDGNSISWFSQDSPIESYYSRRVINDIASYVHEVKKTYRSETLLGPMSTSQATTYASRLAAILGERALTSKLRLNKNFSSLDLSDEFVVSRDRLPGFETEFGTNRELSYTPTQITKSTQSVELELNDQLGIQNVADDWDTF